MTTKKLPRTPSFRCHKASGQGFVELDGQRIYLGRFDRPETRQRYHQVIAEWIANGRQLPVAPEEITVSELIVAYWQHAVEYYRRPDGTGTGEADNIRNAMRPLKNLYGRTRAAELGPRALKAVRQRMIDQGWSRTHVNSQAGRIKRMFRWAVENEKVPVEVYQRLQAVTGLKRGRTEACEPEPVRPVPEAHIEAVRSHVSRQVCAMIDLQLLTGARPGEVVLLRPMDFDTSGKVWTARPAQHKNSYRGRERTIYFGPKAQRIVKQFMVRPPHRGLFSPREAEAERYAGAPTHRRPDQTPNPRKTDRKTGDHYSPNSYRRVIERACRTAGVPVWSPHRLRHNAGTIIRREYGIEAAQLMLGHAKADVTQVYAEVNQAKALKVALEMG